MELVDVATLLVDTSDGYRPDYPTDPQLRRTVPVTDAGVRSKSSSTSSGPTHAGAESSSPAWQQARRRSTSSCTPAVCPAARSSGWWRPSTRSPLPRGRHPAADRARLPRLDVDSEIVRTLADLIDRAPPPRQVLDQIPADAETVVARAALLDRSSTSSAVSCCCSATTTSRRSRPRSRCPTSRSPSSTSTSRLLEFIDAIATERGLAIRTLFADLRDGLPDELLGTRRPRVHRPAVLRRRRRPLPRTCAERARQPRSRPRGHRLRRRRSSTRPRAGGAGAHAAPPGRHRGDLPVVQPLRARASDRRLERSLRVPSDRRHVEAARARDADAPPVHAGTAGRGVGGRGAPLPRSSTRRARWYPAAR